MTMVETPVPVRDNETEQEEHHDDDKEMCHLYNTFLAPLGKTLCGLHMAEDPHGLAHPGQALYFNKGDKLECPLCGAPLCMTCAMRGS